VEPSARFKSRPRPSMLTGGRLWRLFLGSVPVSLPIASMRAFSETFEIFNPTFLAVSMTSLSMYRQVDTLLVMLSHYPIWRHARGASTPLRETLRRSGLLHRIAHTNSDASNPRMADSASCCPFPLCNFVKFSARSLFWCLFSFNPEIVSPYSSHGT
jgi:hypothetical protein